MKKMFMILFAAAAMMVGCSEETTETGSPVGEVSIDVSTLSYKVDGTSVDGVESVTITSSADWRLVGKSEWCHPTKNMGASGESVSFAIDANATTDVRVAEFKAVCANATQTITITQKESVQFDFVKGTTYDVSADAQALTVLVTANEGMVYEVAAESADWISIPETRAAVTQFISFNIAANDTYGDRSGRVIFSVGEEQQAVEINQIQNDAILVDSEFIEASIDGEVITINVDANVPYSSVIAQKNREWITEVDAVSAPTRALESTSVSFNIAPTTSTRGGKISIKNDNTGDIMANIQIVQSIGGERVVIEDEGFKEYLFDNDMLVEFADGTCELAGADQVTVMNCSGYEIDALDALVNFPALINLNCGNNSLDELDLTYTSTIEQLTLSGNPFTLVDLGDNAIDEITFNAYYGLKENGEWSGATPNAPLVIKATALKKLTMKSVYYGYGSFTDETKCVDLRACTAIETVDFGAASWSWNGPKKLILPAALEGQVNVTCDEDEVEIVYM